MVKKNLVDVYDKPLEIVFGLQWEAPPAKGHLFQAGGVYKGRSFTS